VGGGFFETKANMGRNALPMNNDTGDYQDG